MVELVLPTHLLTKQLAKQTILSHNCVVTSVCLGGVVHTGWVGVERCKGDGVLGHRGRLAALLLPSDAHNQTVDVCVCVCVCGMAAARLQQMRGPHVRIRQWHGGAAEPDHTSLSRFPLSRWRAAAGAPLPDNYQPSPQMETSVSPHRSRFLPLPPSTAPLYLGKALPTLTMCFVTAD